MRLVAAILKAQMFQQVNLLAHGGEAPERCYPAVVIAAARPVMGFFSGQPAARDQYWGPNQFQHWAIGWSREYYSL